MRVVQTRNKRFVFGVLLTTLVVGALLTLGQIPLAVSQPVTIPVGKISGPIPMDAANPLWESVPGYCGALKWTNHHHPHASQHFRQNRNGQNGHQRQRDRSVGELGGSDLEQHDHWSAGFPGSNGRTIPGANLRRTAVPMYGTVGGHRQHLALEC